MIVYREDDGCWTVSDSHVKEYYHKMDLRNLFYLKIPTENEFVRFCKDPINIVIFFEKGVVVFTDIGTCAEGHINCWGDTRTNTYRALDYIYTLVDTVVGYVPVWNERTLKYLEKVGFTKVGVIPKYSDTYKGVSDFCLYYRCKNGNEG